MSTEAKDIIFEEQAREKLLAGINKLADILAFTLGPRGANVGLEKSWGAPVISRDGNSIAKEVELKDAFENIGVSMGKEVAAKIKEQCGDGTTTGILLLRALVENGMKNIASGASPIGLKRGMDKAVELLTQEIEKLAMPVQTNEEIGNIASVSAGGDLEVGQILAQAMEQVGKHGVITVEEAKSTETSIDLVEGMQFDRGYVSPYFCTNQESMSVEMHDVYVLLVDKRISSIHELIPVLQAVASKGKELMIVAEDFDAEALSTLVVNRLRGTLKVVAVKSPGFGDRRKAMLEDIAVLTGATVISEDTGMLLKDVTEQALGEAEKVQVTKDNTTIVNGKGHADKIKARVKLIESEIQGTKSSYDAEKLEERKAKLGGGVAIIRVGAATEPELKQKKQMFEDSLNSTKAAVEEGIVAGAGLSMIRASASLKTLKLTGDEEVGAQIVLKACETPMKQIIKNTGMEASIILEQVRQEKGNMGFNSLTEKVEDLYKAGVIDAVKVVKACLWHAVSIAGMVLISEVLVTDAVEEEDGQ